MSEPEFGPEKILGALESHGVRFVLVGGFAAVVYGSPYLTTDVDVVPAVEAENLAHLADALRGLHARVWTEDAPEGLDFDASAEALAGATIWNLVTEFGRLDITFVPSGTHGYDDLARDATHLRVLGVGIDVASLADVIRSKEASGREKDRLVLPVLRRLLTEQERTR
jgi:predicted nucleotidyltransferase